ncbi:MAG: di-heme-cytochrome C peroxidase [Nitrosomonas sp.]|nr:MAG: di-heme-cytochrome C peroxidase [Nitrosomonas sp.]
MKHYRKLFKKRLFSHTACIIAIASLSACKLIPETDPERSGTTVSQDPFGDSYTSIRYLTQGWEAEDSNWFYNTTQGSNLMPYDFFMVLEKVDGELFRSNENMNFYRYLLRNPSSGNPDGLPVGWVKDDYKGQEYIGLTCAACHTGQINYNGVGIRIDGGPAGADMENIMIGMAKALQHTRNNEETKSRFIRNVLARGNYKSETEVLGDLAKYEQRLTNYTIVNRSPTPYGYARLDAFGRIYNRVLEHLINEKELRELLRDPKIMRDQGMSDEDLGKILQDIDKIPTGEQRDRVVERLTQNLTKWQLGRLRKELFNPADAPVSYPFLWDIPQHDYVQWNGLAANAGLGPVGRNTGEVIGVFGTLDWTEERGMTISTLIGGQTTGTKISFDSSVNVQNLRRMESRLEKLQSPRWPEDILGQIDRHGAMRGHAIFNKYCASCHANIDRSDPDRRVVASMSKVSDVGTDSVMAENSFNHAGYSGILRNQYVDVGVGSILLDQKAPAAALLTKATLNVVATPDPDKMFLERWWDWISNIAKAFFHNEIKSSIKHGNYDPDTTAKPLASLNAYKARSLNGIWATAPYLHNGSVPTLYDLLLPAKREGDPENGEYRPEKFEVGSREFDPVKIGLKSSGYQGFTFDTSLRGNSNHGHEYASGKTPQLNGEVLKPLTKEQRLDLLEYLKTL